MTWPVAFVWVGGFVLVGFLAWLFYKAAFN